jgi:hypothetical protein
LVAHFAQKVAFLPHKLAVNRHISYRVAPLAARLL